jgi:UDP-glucose 4-epimerase
VRLLVTGGAGFIGSVVTAYLIDRGYKINILDNLSTGHLANIDTRADFYQGDLMNVTQINEAMRGCDAVIHLAGKAIVSESIENSDSYIMHNYNGTKNILMSMLQLGVQEIVFSSSCAVYGQVEKGLIAETNLLNPINPYGESKLLADNELSQYSLLHNFQCTSLRFFNVAGSYRNKKGQLFGELHKNETHLIPRLLLNNKINIYGHKLNTPDGTCVRDFVHVVDLASAILLSIENKSQSGHRIFNLGSNRGHSVLDVIRTVELLSGNKISVEYLKPRGYDPISLVSDSSLAFYELNWESQFSLESIIKDTMEFMSERNM